MKGWDLIEFGTVASFRNGLNFNRDSHGVGCKIVGVPDFGDRLIPDYETLGEINPFELVKPEDYLEVGDIVFVRSNGNKNLVGRSLFINQKNQPMVFSGFCIRARINSNKIDSLFCAYFFRTDQFRKMISASAGGANIQNLNQGLLSNSLIPNPPLPIQRRIASILSAYDDLIKNNLRRIKLLEELAQRTYEEWFVRFRFPGYETAVFNPETGLPEGWERKEFQFFGTVVTGKTPSTNRKEYFDGEIPFVKTPDMSGFPYVINTNQYLSKIGAKSQGNKFVPKNSLMVSCIGTPGVYALASKDCQTNQQINSIVFHKEKYAFYFYCLAKGLKPILEALGSNGATMTNVNKGKFEKILAVKPNDNLLEKFHQMVKFNFEKILSLQNQNRLLKESRDILLPRLMSGEIELDELRDMEDGMLMAAEPKGEYKIKN